MKSVDNIVIVGAMANNFLAFNGYEVGKSLVEKNSGKRKRLCTFLKDYGNGILLCTNCLEGQQELLRSVRNKTSNKKPTNIPVPVGQQYEQTAIEHVPVFVCNKVFPPASPEEVLEEVPIVKKAKKRLNPNNLPKKKVPIVSKRHLKVHESTDYKLKLE